MLLKISLGLAILVGLATLYVVHFQVGGKLTEYRDSLTQTQTQLTQSQQEEQKAKSDAKTLRAQLDTTSAAYSQATNDLNQAVSKATEQQERADKAAAQLVEVTGQRNEAQQELSTWKVFGLSVDQIRNQLSQLRGAERERDVFASDNTVLLKKVDSLQRRLNKYEGGTEPEVVLPAGTKGNIVAVDPKYDFVILDIGEKQGMLENAKLLVSRDGKLVGKVRVTQVQPDRSVANVMPEWKQPGSEIMEGDQVIF